MKTLLEVRWHGRGGQGAWTASELLARASIEEGKYVQSFPEFGPERMGAPVIAFTRIGTEPINLHCAIYNPDVVVVLDPTLLKSVPITEGMSEDGTVLVNSKERPTTIRTALGTKKGVIWTVSAQDIAMKFLGVPITNTAMLGAFAKVTKLVSLASIEKVVSKRFRRDIAEKNVAVIQEAFREVTSE